MTPPATVLHRSLLTLHAAPYLCRSPLAPAFASVPPPKSRWRLLRSLPPEGLPAELMEEESKFVPLNAEDPMYGPPALLLIGFEKSETHKIQEFLNELDGEFLKIMPCSPRSGVTGDEATSSHTIVTGSGPSRVPGKESSVSLQYPMLRKNNYNAWEIKMKVFMKTQGVWEAMVADDVDKRQDQMALAAIFQGVSEETLLLLVEKEMAKVAWDTLKMMYVGTERVKEARVRTLKREFEGLRMKETESVNDFAVRLTTLVNQIRGLGDKMEESYVVKKLLRADPNSDDFGEPDFVASPDFDAV